MADMATTLQQPSDDQEPLTLKNELAQSSSPYLRAHKSNPVAWQEWSTKSIELARKHQRLIFLSVGYSACHWCHVMERESFSSPEVAAILNESFIPIKLDRESRPDIDDIYMNYVMATTGSGGWPLNVFLTPLLQPAFGGTYWPGPSSGVAVSPNTEEQPVTFLSIIKKLQDVWQHERERCVKSAADIMRQLQAFAAEGIYAHNSVHVRGVDDNDPLEPLDLDLIDDALGHFENRYDPQFGGFVSTPGAPKFASPINITFLLRVGASITRPSTHTRFGFPAPIPAILGKKSCTSAASMALHTLLSISRSALRDHLGHGFHRYSVTSDWNLPHFEKLTSENALLLSSYCDAWALGRDPEILGTIYDLVEYFTDPASPIVRPEGGWYSSEDADSTPVPLQSVSAGGHDDKKEGSFYVWTLREFTSVLGDRDAAILARHFGVKEDGNVPAEHDVHDDFLRHNVLHIDATPSFLAKEFGLKEDEIVKIIKNGKAKLKEHRETKRGKPDVDDKLIVSWNALTIAALARASNTLMPFDEGRGARCRDAAVKATSFIKANLYNAENGKLTRILGTTSNTSDDNGKDLAFVDDYAYLIQALIKVYDVTIDRSYLDFAFKLQETLDRCFYAGANGGYFQAAKSEVTDERGFQSPSTMSPEPFEKANGTSEGQEYTSAAASAVAEPSRPADQILNLKPGTDNALPSPNGTIAQNLLYLASYTSAFDTSLDETVPTEQTESTPAPKTTRSEEMQYQAKKTIDAFAPEIIQHPFLYVTLLGAVVLDTVGVKSLMVSSSMTDAEIENRNLRGFGRTVIRLASALSGIKQGEVMVCTKGACRLLRDGELDNLDDYIEEDDDTIKEVKGTDTVGFPEDKYEDIVDQQTKELREKEALEEDRLRHGGAKSPLHPTNDVTETKTERNVPEDVTN